MLVLRGISYPPSWGFEGTDLARLAHLECPTVCHGEPWREEDFCVIPTVCHGHPVQIFSKNSFAQVNLDSFVLENLLRREGDSNPRNPFGVYTLSRRASSTTRASLLCVSN